MVSGEMLFDGNGCSKKKLSDAFWDNDYLVSSPGSGLVSGSWKTLWIRDVKFATSLWYIIRYFRHSLLWQVPDFEAKKVDATDDRVVLCIAPQCKAQDLYSDKTTVHLPNFPDCFVDSSLVSEA